MQINLKTLLIKRLKEIQDLAEEYKLLHKISVIVENSGVLKEIKSQIADFALVAVYQAEFAFNKIGTEKKKIAFRMLCNFIKYPIALKPFKRLIENILYDFVNNKIEEAVQKMKEHLKNV